MKKVLWLFKILHVNDYPMSDYGFTDISLDKP